MRKQWKRLAVLLMMAAIVLVLFPGKVLADETEDDEDNLEEGTIVEILDEPVPIISEPGNSSDSGNAEDNHQPGAPAPETGDPVMIYLSMAALASSGLGAGILKSHIRVSNTAGKGNKRVFTK